MKPCQECGKEIKIDPRYRTPYRERVRKFCGRECFGKSYSRNLLAKRPIKLCLNCSGYIPSNNPRTISHKKYCGRKCFGEYKARKNAANRPRMYCQGCGKELAKSPREGASRWISRKFCDMRCRTGSLNSRWRGGRGYHKELRGYVRVNMGSNQREVEHRVVAEKALGRKLKPNEIVHHINCDKSDNRNENLLICERGYHKWLHDEMGRRYAQEHFAPKPNAADIAFGNAC